MDDKQLTIINYQLIGDQYFFVRSFALLSLESANLQQAKFRKADLEGVNTKNFDHSQGNLNEFNFIDNKITLLRISNEISVVLAIGISIFQGALYS